MTITHRDVAPGFEAVAAVVEAAAADDDYQAQLHVRVGGRVVVDIAAGIAPDALMTVYSSSKGLAAIALALLVDDGLLDLDAIVAIDGIPVSNAEDVVRIVANRLEPGETARFTVVRGTARRVVAVRLGARPPAG